MANTETSRPGHGSESLKPLAVPDGLREKIGNTIHGLVAAVRGEFQKTEDFESGDYYNQNMKELNEMRETTDQNKSIEQILELEKSLKVWEDLRKEELLLMSDDEIFDIKNTLCDEKGKQIEGAKQLGMGEDVYNQNMQRLEHMKANRDRSDNIMQILALEENLGVWKNRRKEELLSMNKDQVFAIKNTLCDEREKQIKDFAYEYCIENLLINSGVKAEVALESSSLLFNLLNFEEGGIVSDETLLGRKNNITSIVDTFALSLNQKKQLVVLLHNLVDRNYKTAIDQGETVYH